MAETQYITIPDGGTGVQVASAAGENLWREIQGTDALKQMADALPNPAVGEKLTRDKLTVPTPWSSVVTFDILLDSDINYGHVQENTRNEWKTLITLIALHKIRNIPITFEQIQDVSSDFYKNIQMQYPKNGIFKDWFDGVNKIEKEKESWKNITLIKLSGEVIGMLTPSNIVCSRYAYNETATPNAVQWFKKNGLMNDDCDMLNPIQYILKTDGIPDQVSLNYITSWLRKIREFLNAKHANGETVFDVPATLIGRIDAFINEIIMFAQAQGFTAENIVLKDSVKPSEFMNIREMIESIQGEHSWKGLLTAIAYAGLSNYNITYVESYEQTKMVCKGLFHQSIINDPSARAVLLDGKCIGVIRNYYILSVPTKALPEDTVAKLKECRLMNDGAEYKDPVEFILENPKRFAYIISWLNYVQTKLASVQPITDFAANNEIAEFINKLNVSLNVKDPNFRAEAETLRNTLAQFTNTGANTVFELFSTLTSSCDFVNTGIEAATMIAGANNMVLFGEDTITGDLLNYYNKSKLPGSSVSVVRSSNINVFDSDNVFEDKIYYISDIDNGKSDDKRINNADDKNLWSIKKHINGGVDKAYTVLWPIKQSIFASISSDAIYNGISYDYDDKEDKCTIKLHLAVVGGGGTGRVITKTFDGPDNANSINSGVIESYLLPGISIWPYAVSNPADTNKWNTYFTYETKTQKYADTGMPNPYVVACMPQEANLSENILDLSSDVDEYCRKIKCRKSIPEYLMIMDTYGKSYGMILLEKPLVMPTKNGTTLDIGLDFGTSSTTIYSSIGGIKSPVRFDNDMAIEPICHSYDDASSYFIPKEYSSNNYYPSLLRISSNTMPPMANGIKLPFLNKNIIFQYKYFRNGADGDEHNNTVLKSNIKWDPIAPDNTQMYLRQIVMQTILAAMKNGTSTINWHASYPSAFSERQIADYQSGLQNIIDNMHALVNNSVAKGGLDFETESIAAAKYIVSNAANDGRSLVTIVDIGGGSTDISSWKVGAGIPLPLFQTSIEIASRVIFLEPLKELIKGDDTLKQNIRELGHPFSNIDKYVKEMNEGIEEGTANFNVLVEQLLLLYSDTIMGTINGLPNQTEVKRFQQKVVTGFYAILFYAIKSFVAKTSNQIGDMVIQLSGNGAKLFNWIPQIDIQKIETLLSRLINNKAGNDIKIKIAFNSNTAKTEAARGMLENIGDVNAPAPVVICGTDIDLTYMDANGIEKVERIGKNSNMWDNDIIKQCYANNAGVTPIQFNTTGDRDLCKEFMDQVQNEIYGGTISINVEESTMASKVTTDMGQSLKSKRLTSPFFSQIKAIISEM